MAVAWNSGITSLTGAPGKESSNLSIATNGWGAQSDATALANAIDLTLKDLLPSRSAPPANLHDAMHYAVLAPGKRLRPLLTLLTAGEDYRSDPQALELACVSELVHTASLILDDLPCMDDAQMRRNQPCTHLLYSESTTILASVNLLNLAYGLIARNHTLRPEVTATVSAHLSDVIGSMGLVGGQVEDLQNRAYAADAVQQLYHQKTGCLFEFAVVTGARMRGMDDAKISALKLFSRAFGLLFQVYDDVLDDQAFAGESGKDTGKDVGKSTLLASLRAGQIEQMVENTKHSMQQHLARAELDESPLAEFVEYQVLRFDQAVQKLRQVL